MPTVDRVLTDTPIIDELVYLTKTMALGTIIKDTDEALQYETLESIKKSDLYIACINGRSTFMMFESYTMDMFVAVDLQPIALREKCLTDKTLVPLVYRDSLTKMATTKYINDYNSQGLELNNYYRMLNGIPNIEDMGVYPININQSLEPGIYVKDYPGIPEGLDLTIPLHEYDSSIIELLRNLGIIDMVKSDYPDKKYLNYIGNRKIKIYDARTASDFGILYVPKIDIQDVYQKYLTHLERNRVYIIKAIYNEAFKLESDYYNKFIIILIILQSFVDMIISTPEYLIRRDVFDIRTIQYIFEGYDVEYYKEIPLKYQIALVKNLNKLLKYKSTSKNMVDICQLFGFEDIDVFKYYILRDRRVDGDGNFIYNYKQIDDPNNPGQKITVEDVENNYELKFFKMPIDGDVEMYVRDALNFISYDMITSQDKYWDGDRSHEEVKKDIIEREFNILQSKYISIDSVYHLTNLSFERPYFFSILFEEDRRADGIKVSVPYITNTKTFRFTDIICFLYALMYEYYGIEDTLLDSTTKIMHVKGFNFKVDMAALSKYIRDNGFTLEELGISNFKIPQGKILTFGQLIDIFTNNEKIYYHIEKELYNANDYSIYKIYKTIYESLMIYDENMNFFKKSNGEVAVSYSDFLQDRDIVLYDVFNEIKMMSSPDEKITALINMVNFTILSIDEYIDTDEYKHLFSNMPTESAAAIQKYIYKVINFFKSYKIDILSINNIYKLDDSSNKIIMIDKKFITAMIDKFDKYDGHYDKLYKILSKLSKSSGLEYNDILPEIIAYINYKDNIIFNDEIIKNYEAQMEYKDVSIINDVFKPTSQIQIKDEGLNIIDRLWISQI